MPDRRPLLIFPSARTVSPPKARGFPPALPPMPSHERQVERLAPQMQNIKSEFESFKGTIDQTGMGGDPELVIVLELATKIDVLQRAVKTAGLEWLGEWDEEQEADDDFPASSKGAKRDARLFVSMANQHGSDAILALWHDWEKKKKLAHGKKIWGDIFACLKKIRLWGREDSLIGTGMQEYFTRLALSETASFQIELFYRTDSTKRNDAEKEIMHRLAKGRGQKISDFIHIPEIAFHAVKVRMPATYITPLLTAVQSENHHLFAYPGVMYFHKTGQSMVSQVASAGEEAIYPQTEVEQPPVAAILDGVPNLQHQALKNRIDFDDPFELAEKYQSGERQHGTAMASLVIHGDRSCGSTQPIGSRIHHVAVMQPNEKARPFNGNIEHFPEECFFEDRIEQAVHRILKSDGEVQAQAPGVKIINLSVGDQARPFHHTPSPCAKLLDWLSWKYRVLFCVSAGNCSNNYDFGIPYSEYQLKSAEEKKQLLHKAMQDESINRRLLSPAESINALTIGALHQDECGVDYHAGLRIDLLPEDQLISPRNQLISPVSCLGHGFRRSVKPEIYFPGGRQLYREPFLPSSREFIIHDFPSKPGQKVACDSTKVGELSKDTYTRGTSNATALATRAGVLIHDVLTQLNNEQENPIPDNLMAVLIKTLLVHGSRQDEESKRMLEHLASSNNSSSRKYIWSKFLGYGAVNIERVLACTAQRGTVIGCDEISVDESHQYRFPIPEEFSGKKIFRRMVVTLAWFSPINVRHRHLRSAKLDIAPGKKWVETPLKIERTDGDSYQVKRGTVQHEVLEGKNKLSAFQQDEEIVLQVNCKRDATDNLDESIPYALAVTLEVDEASQIPVYKKISERLSEQVKVRAL